MRDISPVILTRAEASVDGRRSAGSGSVSGEFPVAREARVSKKLMA